MASPSDTASMALFCDFENIALGVRDAQYDKFDIRPVLERLLAKGSIVVKKAYCDWERYKGFKAAMHEANFELIEIPHVRQSGKNSADIRMVVDALDLCYTKAHVDTFVIISGDSDFSPLVSKLRENAKKVIGVGVKQSCSDLLITNCDEFIYYDDLVRDRESQRNALRRERDNGKRSPEEEEKRRDKIESRKTKAVELAASTFADMMADRGENDRVWASVLKEVMKRRNPGFNESYFGFRTFGNLLEEAVNRGLLAVGRDEKSGTYVMRAQTRPVETEVPAAEPKLLGESNAVSQGDFLPGVVASLEATKSEEGAASVPEEKPSSRRRGGRHSRKDGRGRAASEAPAVAAPPLEMSAEPQAAPVEAAAVAPVEEAPVEEAPKPRRGRRPRKEVEAIAPAAEVAPPAAAAEKPKTQRRAPRSRKPKTEAES
jgi:uncharacterized protein (TIGR00288 family)